MHGLINRSLQSFLTDAYGQDTWDAIVRDADLGFHDFEAMLAYDDRLTHAVLTAAAIRLDRTAVALLEDMGTYLVSHPRVQAVRRLLRFGGDDFIQFLGSLDDLPDRARLAVPDLDMPALAVEDRGAGRYLLRCEGGFEGFCHLVLGALRAMADDYGTLASLDLVPGRGPGALIRITVHDIRFAEARRFDLAADA